MAAPQYNFVHGCISIDAILVIDNGNSKAPNTSKPLTPTKSAAGNLNIATTAPSGGRFAFKLFGLRGCGYQKPQHAIDYSPDSLPPEALAAAAAAGGDAASDARDPLAASAGRWLSPHLTPKLDAWGLGAVMAQLALGAALPTGAAAAAAGVGPSPWRSHASWAALLPELQATIDAFCAEDPAARATIAEALSMSFATMELPAGCEEEEGEHEWGQEAVAAKPALQQPPTPLSSGAPRPPASESEASEEGSVPAKVAEAVPVDASVVVAAAACGMTLDAVALRNSCSGSRAREEEITSASDCPPDWQPPPASSGKAAGREATGGAAVPLPALVRAVLGHALEKDGTEHKEGGASAGSGRQSGAPRARGLWARGAHMASKRGREMRAALVRAFQGCSGSPAAGYRAQTATS
jgi:hypothetical protein